MRKIYVVGGGKYYANWMQGEIVNRLEDADLVVFTGGEDVSPSMYNEPKNPKTYSNANRDLHEAIIFKKANELNKHIIGICRGAQFSCVMSGGRLVQHQENPHFIHDIYVNDGVRTIPITSTHHQAMYPYNMPHENYQVLGWTQGISGTHQDGNTEEIPITKEVEICYFPKTKALGIQGHPEMMDEKKHPETFEYLKMLLTDHLNDKL